MKDSPVLGLLNEDKSVKLETEEAEGNGKNAFPSETIINKAIRKRYSYVKANSEYATYSLNICHSVFTLQCYISYVSHIT